MVGSHVGKLVVKRPESLGVPWITLAPRAWIEKGFGVTDVHNHHMQTSILDKLAG